MSGCCVSKGGRAPNKTDLRRMQRAVSYVTAYDLGIQVEDFSHFLQMTEEENEHKAMLHALAQFTWLLLRSLEESGYDKSRILEWYGMKFACSAEEWADEDS